MGQSKSKSKKKVAPTPVVQDLKVEIKSNNDTTLQKPASAESSAPPQSSSVETKPTEPQSDPQQIPAWLTEELFVDLLRENDESFERITKFKPHAAMAPGENYSTLMLRISIDVELKDHNEKNISFMLKVPHDNEQTNEFLSVVNSFIPENMMYLEVLPELHQMYKDVGIDCFLAAKAYKFPKPAIEHTVLLQDLRPLGFKNANRLDCLDMEHAEFVLRKLAQFHAASATLVATKKPFEDCLMKGLIWGNPKAEALSETMLGSMTATFLKNVKTFNDGEKYEPFYIEFVKNMAKELQKASVWSEDEFNVLNHGDCWTNNILFQYDDKGEITDMVFVDFQMPKYGSPAQDLIYFIFSSVRVDIKFKHFDYFIRYYYDHLIENLKLLKYPKRMPVLRELHMQLLKYNCWPMWTTVIALPIILLDSSRIAKMDNIMATDDDGTLFRNAIFTNKRYHEHMNEMLPWLYNRGLLESYDYSNEISTDHKLMTTNANPTIETPEWVTVEIFNDVLTKNFEGFKSIKDFKVSAGTAGGDNYCSLMLQIDIEIELGNGASKSTSYMLKIPPLAEQSKIMLSQLNIFKKEIEVYTEILPEFEKILGNVGVSVDFGPNSFDLVNKPEEDVLLLENMRPSGYKNENRLEGLDEDHVKAVLEKIAQFHAASAYYALNKNFPNYMNHGMFVEEQREIFESMMALFEPIYRECLKTYKGQEEYAEKVIQACKTNFDDMSKATQNTGNKFNVLNHGDCWTNNILFKHDGNGKIENVFLIDYQLVQYGSPAYDLYYFLMSSPKLELKTEKFDYFIKYYHDHLVENLKLLKYPNYVPSLKELHEEMLIKGVFGSSVVMGVMGVILLDPTKKANIETIMNKSGSGDELRKQMYMSPRYKKHAETLFTWLNRRGCLDQDDFSKQSDSVTVTSQPTIAIPQWVTSEIFSNVLKKNFEGFKSIKDFKVSAGTAGGDNYCSLILQINVEMELENGSSKAADFMLKVAPSGEKTNAMLNQLNTFSKEIATYKEIIPKFEEILKHAGINVQFGPNSYDLAEIPEKNVILMDNMRPLGYKNENRLEGLDQEHVEAVLRKIAQFHAASAVYMLGKGVPDVMIHSMFTEERREFSENMAAIFRPIFRECLKTYASHEEYMEKINDYSMSFYDSMVKASKYTENKFNVLNHGDVWTNNILFKHDDNGKIENVLLIDYQVIQYGSPAYDLYYFLMSSPKLELKTEKFDYFIKYYHDHLVENLKLLKYPNYVPSLKELHEEMIIKSVFAYFLIMNILTTILLDPSDQASMENFMSPTETGEKLRRHIYINPRYKKHAELLFPWLSRRGCFDIDSTVTTAEYALVTIIPDWLDENYFKTLLEENIEEFSKICSLKKEIATKAGDNYASTVLKVEIKVELKDHTIKTFHYIVKLPSDSEQGNFLSEVWNSFKKEITMYSEHLPDFESLYDKAGQGLKFAPAYYTSKNVSHDDIVIMENLHHRGFKNADRLQGLDEEHTKLVLRKMAQFHAASVKRVENLGKYPEYFNDGTYNERSRSMFEYIMKGTNKAIMESTKLYAGNDEYIHKLQKLFDIYLDESIALNKVDEHDFNVLNHYDCWVNNIMFQYDDGGNVKDVLFIDFQDCKYGSPAYDLYNFLISSTQLENKVEKFDYFVKYYHDNLVECLKDLDFKGNVINLKELHECLLKYGFLGLSALWGLASLSLLEPSEEITLDNIISETDSSNEIRINMYSNARYKSHAEKVLTWLNRRGCLDY